MNYSMSFHKYGKYSDIPSWNFYKEVNGENSFIELKSSNQTKGSLFVIFGTEVQVRFEKHTHSYIPFSVKSQSIHCTKTIAIHIMCCHL